MKAWSVHLMFTNLSDTLVVHCKWIALWVVNKDRHSIMCVWRSHRTEPVRCPALIQCWRNKLRGVDVVTIIIIHHIEDVQLDQYFIYTRAYNKLKLFWGGHAGRYFSMGWRKNYKLSLSFQMSMNITERMKDKQKGHLVSVNREMT